MDMEHEINPAVANRKIHLILSVQYSKLLQMMRGEKWKKVQLEKCENEIFIVNESQS